MARQLIGRVVAAGEGCFALQPVGDEAQVTLTGVARAGDWVRVSFEPKAVDAAPRADRPGVTASEVAPPRAEAIEVLTRCLHDEFPAPGGEWFRMRADGGRRLRNLAARSSALRTLRGWFDAREFVEIEVPLLVPAPGMEVHLDAFPVENRYLITSPEYQLKRLLAAGLPRIYSVARSFRRGESGPHHNPEFTMIEWYRAPGRWEEIAADVEAVCASVVAAVRGQTRIDYLGEPLDLTPPWPRLTVREAMARHAGIALDGDEPVEVLRRKCRDAGYDVPDELPWDDVFFSVFLDAVEPHLGRGRPTILHDWPVPLGALARRKPDDPRVVERFEAYAGGLELCNGFGELVDPVEQARRFEVEVATRRARGLPVYPVDRRFLSALEEGLPPSGGVALGFDRLVMLACDAASLREVSAFVDDEL